MGFNNAGLDAFAHRLERRPRAAVIGANLGANKDTEDKAADYVTGLVRLRGLADYFTVNVSSPNTPGLRNLQGRAALDDLLGRLAEARGAEPLFLKIAPDLTEADVAMIVEACLAHGASQGRLALIGVGGIASGADAYACIRAGASAVQVYSALIYEGPGLVMRIRRELADRLTADGFGSVAEAVGAR